MGLVTIVELPGFIRDAEAGLPADELDALKLHLAANPKAGDVVPGTGGLRKLRWAASGRGKRGGARIVYFFHNARMPLFLIALFTKNEKSDLSPDERKAAAKLAAALVEAYLPKEPK